MGTILVLHLASIAALFLSAPYGKFVHAVYRTLAILRYEVEQSQPHEHVGH
jgi:citrate/tricarballylate utilization protein